MLAGCSGAVRGDSLCSVHFWEQNSKAEINMLIAFLVTVILQLCAKLSKYGAFRVEQKGNLCCAVTLFLSCPRKTDL